ncbi:MAG TPA: T9SS type A sorting domain-containing protein, partial [Gillisia sp.]|nr:T9SS type A sorting domain-containing protein [Gillisia sp.]
DIDIFYMGNNKELAISNPYLLPIQRVEIYNLLGQKIQQYIEISNQKEIRLPVLEYATGIYIVKLYTENLQVSKNIMLNK